MKFYEFNPNKKDNKSTGILFWSLKLEFLVKMYHILSPFITMQHLTLWFGLMKRRRLEPGSIKNWLLVPFTVLVCRLLMSINSLQWSISYTDWKIGKKVIKFHVILTIIKITWCLFFVCLSAYGVIKQKLLNQFVYSFAKKWLVAYSISDYLVVT